MNIKEFAQYVMDTVQDSAENNDTDVNTELVRYYLDCMEECDEVSAPEICVFSGAKAKLTAYDYNDEAESLDLFLFIHATPLASRIDSRVRTVSIISVSFTINALKRNHHFMDLKVSLPAKFKMQLIL